MAASAYARPGYSWFVLFILTLAYAAHSMDRAMPNILIEPVRAEFHLKDSQLGLFAGAYFGLGFVFAVLPMGYLADRINRRTLLSVIMVVWSACTALGGFTRSFGTLLLTRGAVGVAESGASPIILPLITDIFPKHRRSFAMGLLYVGVPFGGILAAGAGGLIAAAYGWRMALMLAGIPGLFLAVLVMIFVREPGRGASDETPEQKPAPLPEVLKFLVSQPAILCIMGAGVLIGWISITIGSWASSYYIRVHHLKLSEVAVIQSLALGGCGLLAPPLFGWIADRVSGRSPILPLIITAIAGAVSFMFGQAWLFGTVLPLIVVCQVLGEFFRQGYPPLLYPVVLGRTPPHMRGVVMSVIQGTTNLIGFTFGPAVLGELSDALGGGTAIRTAMAYGFGMYGVIITLLIAASLLLRRPNTVAPAAAG